MSKDFEAMKKLDEAIQALKAAGYEFTRHSITDIETVGTYKDKYSRHIEVKCYKRFPISEGQVSELRGLANFRMEPNP